MEREEYIIGLAHIGIPTQNLEDSKRFFEAIGFNLLENFRQPNGKPVFFFRYENVVLEIYEGETVGKSGAIDHIALVVRNIEAVFDNMEKLGYKALEGEIKFLDFGVRCVRYFTISGPNKEKIEFSQSV